MADEYELLQAKQVYKSIVNMLEKRDWKFEEYKDDLVIKSAI
jgi:hypothetical protein